MEVYGCMLAWGGSGHYPGGSAGIVVSLKHFNLGVQGTISKLAIDTKHEDGQ